MPNTTKSRPLHMEQCSIVTIIPALRIGVALEPDSAEQALESEEVFQRDTSIWSMQSIDPAINRASCEFVVIAGY